MEKDKLLEETKRIPSEELLSKEELLSQTDLSGAEDFLDEDQEFSLEDILKEFGGADLAEEEVLEMEEIPEPEEIQEPESAPESAPAEENSVVTGDTVRIDTLGVTSDTVRLDTIAVARGKVKNAVRITDEEPDVIIHKPEAGEEPFSEKWEPEYEQPMGEYVPVQPIIFHPHSRLRELKRKLVAGPEKRYYDLSEKGLGKLQAAIFLSVLVVLISAASTALYALGMVQENRLRLMIFGQFLAMLISALLGSFQLLEGVADLCKKRFSLNSLLVFTFIACCVDGIFCLQQLRVPCCAAFSLEMTMSLWSTYQRRNTEL